VKEHGKLSRTTTDQPGKRECPAAPASSTAINRPRWVHRLVAKPRNLVGYAAMLARGVGRGPANEDERNLNEDLVGYPHNHLYRLRARQPIPDFSLYRRLRAVEPAYPATIESFLDVGCCRGYFVLDAARRVSCRTAVGIDVHEPFVAISSRVSRHLGMENTAFHHANLRTVSDRPESFGGPFQVVTMLNTYHYAYWGSERYPDAFHDDREILRCLSRICTDRVVFSARLEVDRLPSFVRERAMTSGQADNYTTGHFLAAATEFFDVRAAASGPGDPVSLMLRKHE
jgi:SAM-dependent methyltransferase